MKNLTIPTSLSRVVGKQVLLASKHSPTLLFAGGILCIIGGTVLACRATLKVEEILDQTDLDITSIKTAEGVDDYAEMDRNKDLAVAYARTAVKLGKTYGPAIVVTGLGIASLTTSHRILLNRNAALAAAYATLDAGFKKYRERVVDKFGADQDREFRYGVDHVEVRDEKTGRKKIVTKIKGEPSIYARLFDQTNTEWSKEPEYNRVFLQAQQAWANNILQARGHLFLNEVYDALRLDRSKAGQVVGWMLGNGDSFVDFGIFDDPDFVNLREGSIMLDFNVDGVIYDKVDFRGEALKWQQD